MQGDLDYSHSSVICARVAGEQKDGYLRDWIYGATNGAVTTFAIVAGVVGANLPTTVALLVGIANLVANGFATAARNYARAKSNRDNYDPLRAIKRDQIVAALNKSQASGGSALTNDEFERIAAVNDLWPPISSPVQAALSAFTAFIVCGLVPLMTFLLVGGLTVCIVATGFTFFIIGTIKSRYSLKKWWRSGLDSFFLGMSAAALAFGVAHTMLLLIKLPPT